MNTNQIFESAHKVWLLENTLGYEAQHVAKYINENIKNSIIVCEKEQQGMHTDAKVKENMYVLLNDLLDLLMKDMIHFDTNYFSHSKGSEKCKESCKIN